MAIQSGCVAPHWIWLISPSAAVYARIGSSMARGICCTSQISAWWSSPIGREKGVSARSWLGFGSLYSSYVQVLILSNTFVKWYFIILIVFNLLDSTKIVPSIAHFTYIKSEKKRQKNDITISKNSGPLTLLRKHSTNLRSPRKSQEGIKLSQPDTYPPCKYVLMNVVPRQSHSHTPGGCWAAPLGCKGHARPE